MEHEDNAQLDNFLQGSPHLRENLQMASGDSMCDNAVAEDIGGKFVELEEHDEEEWKYIKEGQQSEKHQQQQMKAGIDCKDIEIVEEVGNGYVFGYEHGNVGDTNMLLVDQHEVGNGVVGISAAVDVDVTTDIEENKEVEVIKNDGDFSTTSNTTSTAGDDGDATSDVLQVDMKIEPAPIEQLLPQQSEDLLGGVDAVGHLAGETEEDEPSSLATNTTNGTNSLSENAPQQQLQEAFPKDVEFLMDDKENTDPLSTNTGNDGSDNDNGAVRPSDLDFEMHSQLNPNATEFVPSFGSNPASPVAPTSVNFAFGVGEPALNAVADIQLQPHPSTIPRHLLGDDDFVAQSPRKGSGESNLDGIALPEENDFEHEAAKRPHELEQEDDLIGVGTVQQSQQDSHLFNDELETINNDCVQFDNNCGEDGLDFGRQAPSTFIDHGPETCVDLEADIDMQSNDALKITQQQELIKEKVESIEDVLNTVQPLPTFTESLDASFEHTPQELAVAEKELLDFEEKENISNSPSTEEMQMNLQNELHSSVKDIPQIPIDLDNAAHMQESIYVKSTSSGVPPQIEQHCETENLIEDNRLSVEENIFKEISFENVRAPEYSAQEAESFVGAPESLNVFTTEFAPTHQLVGDNVITPSPISTEEKHLVEETKEQTLCSEHIEELEQKMDDLILSAKDGILSQVEEVAQDAAHIVDSLNPFAASEPEPQEKVEQSLIEAEQPFSTESHPHPGFLQTNEQFYHNDQHEQEKSTESAYVYQEDNLFSTQPAEQPPASPDKVETELNGFDETVPAPISVEANYAATPAEFEPVVLSNEPALEQTATAESEILVPEHIIQSEPEPVHALASDPEPALEVSNEIVANLSIANESLLLKSQESDFAAPDAILEPAIAAAKPSDDVLVAAAAVSAVAATAAVALGAVDAPTTKKTETKKTTPTSTKAKVVDIKKSAESTKKPVAVKTVISTTSTARPRTAPTKPATSVEKKSTTAAVTNKPSTTTATRKPLTSTATTPRTITKATSARPATAPAAAKPAVSRTSTTTTARRSAPTAPSSSATTTNGTAAAKPKPTSGAPIKPTTLGISATTKPKLSSPRTTLTSQLRKAAPTGMATARSPLKATAPTTNGVTRSSMSTTTASRAKSSTSTTVTRTTTTAKTFTARPAPKTTRSTTTTTRRIVGSVPSSSTTAARTTSSMLQKKTPPGGNTRLSTTGKSSLSPTKTTSAALKAKTKEVTKKSISPTKTANDLKQKPATEEPKINGARVEDVLGNQLEQQAAAPLNGEGGGRQEFLENGMLHMKLENGEGSLSALIDA